MEKRIQGAGLLIIILLVVAGGVRLLFCHALPLSGDEVGVGVLQATGQALTYDAMPVDRLHSMEELKAFIDYSPEHSLGDVCRSLRYSGMHPPFYYFLLHYLIRFAGNGLLTLRILSILFSVASLWLLYRLGRELFGDAVGLLAAMLLAASPYGLQYGVMVRPYPLLMFLSLLSTLQLVLMVKNDGWSFRKKSLYLYMLVCIVGLYSLYHFLFVVAAHFLFLLIAATRSFKRLLIHMVPFLLIGTAFIPWLPSLEDQLHVITNESYSYYFNGDYTLPDLMVRTVDLQLWQYPFDRILPGSGAHVVRIAIETIAFLLLLPGAFMAFCASKRSRAFLVAIVGYILIHFAGDRIMETLTLAQNKFEFFLIPVVLLIIALGIRSMTRCIYLNGGVAALFIALSALGSMQIYGAKLNFDGPAVITTFKREMEARCEKGSRSLILIDTRERRQVLSFAHAVNIEGDVAFLVEDDIERDMTLLSNLTGLPDPADTLTLGKTLTPANTSTPAKTSAMARTSIMDRYDRIFLVDLHVFQDKRPNFTSDERKRIALYVRKSGFGVITYLYKSPKNKLVMFGRGES